MSTRPLPVVCFAVMAALASSPARGESVEVKTADGAQLRGKRYPTRGAPLILLHGLMANLYQFDLGEEGAPSLASYLHERGFDVWLWNLRGSGRGELESLLPDGAEDWTADEHIGADLPAILAHVRERSGQRPLLLGHSLGGMVAAAYLAGAAAIDPARPRAGMIANPALAALRAHEVRGAVLVSAPLRLRWRDGEGSRLLRRLATIGRTPVAHLLPTRLRISALADLASRTGAQGGVGRALDAFESFVVENFLQDDRAGPWLELLVGERSRKRAIVLIRKLRGQVLSDASRALLLQLAASAKKESWLSQTEAGGAQVDYAAQLGRIAVPLLAITGTDDSVAPPEAVRSTLDECTASPERRFLAVPSYGHADITLGEEAHRDVFPAIAGWLEEHALD